MQLWTLTASIPQLAASLGSRAEADGWDGLAMVDSQNLAGDTYVALGLAAAATERIELGTAVTNPITRHPAVTAAAIASIHLVSAGRATLGIGRGDSALAHLGRSPATVDRLERYVATLQQYLRGDAVGFEDLDFHEQLAPPVDVLALADQPDQSRITWLPEDLEKVTVEVASTGPRVIGVAAREADRVLLALGADTDRLSWGIETAQRARSDAGLDPDAVSFGAYVNLVCHTDADVARALARGGLSTFARFSVMHGRTHGPVTDVQRDVLTDVHDRYDIRSHTRADSVQADVLTDAFVDEYAIVGDPDSCRARLEVLEALGLDKVIVIGPTPGVDRDAARESAKLLRDHVLTSRGTARSRGSTRPPSPAA